MATLKKMKSSEAAQNQTPILKKLTLIDEVNYHTIDASIIFDTLLLKRERRFLKNIK